MPPMTGSSNAVNADRCGLPRVPSQSCCPSQYTARIRVKIHHQQSSFGGTVGVRARAKHQHPMPHLSSSWKGRDGGRWTTRSLARAKHQHPKPHFKIDFCHWRCPWFRCCLVLWLRARFTRSHTFWCLVKETNLILLGRIYWFLLPSRRNGECYFPL